MSLAPGQTIGHFRLQEKIGQGGMGVVWKAEDTRLGRAVAIKILTALSASDERLRRMFLDEARLASSLSDAHIAQVHELGREADLDYIVMEYVEGSPLSRLIQGKPMPPATVAAVGAQVAEGLARTHRKSLLHRDLKPANIIVDSEGHAKVVDFGLATLFQRPDHATRSEAPTLTGPPVASTIMGTIFYMSPEQLRGESLDGRTDIFSLGVVLYQMTTGRLPFSSDDNEDLRAQILRSHPAPAREVVPRLPFELDRIIQKCMAARRTDRYQSMEDLSVDLRRLGEELETGSAPSYGDLGRAPRPSSVHSGWRYLLFAAAMLLFAIAGGLWMIARHDRAVAASTVLILPLDVRGQTEGADYAGRAFAEALAVNLARLKGVTVLPVPSAQLPRDADALAPARAGRDVGAGRVLNGALTREGSVLDASLNLIDATRNRIVWGTREKAGNDDLPRLAATLARQTAIALGEEPPRLYEYFKNVAATSGVPASADFAEALAAVRIYDTPRALAATKRLVDAFPSDATARVLRAFALALDAVEFSASSPQRQALEQGIQMIAAVDPNSPWDDVFRARFLVRDGADREAIGMLSAVLERDDLTPGARAYVLNGRSLAERRIEPAAAETDLREALRLDPLNDVTILTMTQALMGQRRLDEALESARRGVALNPFSPWNRNTLGDVLYRMQRYDEAAEALAAACEQDHTQSSCAYHSVALLMARRTVEAKEVAIQAASLPESDLGTYNLACYQALVGQRAEALRLLRRSLQLGPFDPKEIMEDAALSSLRDDPGFKALMADARNRSGGR